MMKWLFIEIQAPFLSTEGNKESSNLYIRPICEIVITLIYNDNPIYMSLPCADNITPSFFFAVHQLITMYNARSIAGNNSPISLGIPKQVI